MIDLNLKILGSSSKGNCYILKTSKETLILECGLNYKEIQKGLNFELSNIVGCLVSHEHKDHSKSIKELTQNSIKVYSGAGTFNRLGIENHNVNPVKALEQFQIGDFIILPFDVQHDAAEPLGFLIQHPEFGKLLFATDTYYIKYQFDGLNHILVECNYSEKIIDRLLEEGKILETVYNRLKRSHLSLEKLKVFLNSNNLSDVYGIILLHLSDMNSDSNLFKEDIEKLTGIPVTIAGD
ncbi:MAG: hypothetical protein JEZ01_20490 [Labilibaculum sp.]|nr:MBL fold metallo-hydrolase [Labilibaculum sp.]MBI9060158.1 hypothetical protein [Labilibaculum sp.]